MYGQDAAGWKALRKMHEDKKVVLRADSVTLESLRSSGSLKLRLFCEDGNAIVLHLENKNPEVSGTGYGQIRIVTLTVPKAKLLDCLENELDVIFWDDERGKGAVFRAAAICRDGWLAGMKLLCEPIQ